MYPSLKNISPRNAQILSSPMEDIAYEELNKHVVKRLVISLVADPV